jgi:hypothetical protein
VLSSSSILRLFRKLNVSNKLHGVTFQKTANVIVTIVMAVGITLRYRGGDVKMTARVADTAARYV